MAGAGASAAVAYSLTGVSHRTFTANLPAVKKASARALENIGIEVQAYGKLDAGVIVYARAAERSVEIELEPISPRATRMRVAARDGGLFYDNATSREIVAQTEKMLAGSVVTKFTAKTRRVSTY